MPFAEQHYLLELGSCSSIFAFPVFPLPMDFDFYLCDIGIVHFVSISTGGSGQHVFARLGDLTPPGLLNISAPAELQLLSGN